MRREDLNTILNQFTDKYVKIRGDRKREALDSWEPIVKNIVDYVKQKDPRNSGHRPFDALGPLVDTLHTGSYYERAKVKEPDEFDLMLVMGNLELVDDPYEPYEEDDGLGDPPKGFTRVMIDMGEEVQWQREGCVDRRGMLNATQVKAIFKGLVREAIRNRRYSGVRNVDVKSEGPAVTLKVVNRNGREYSVDLTLAIKDKSWPEDAEEWKTRHRNGWPNQQLIRDICIEGCHLVAKQPKGHHLAEQERGFLWRYSFSEAEKKLFLQGGHGEASSCRKQVLRILKALKEELHLQPLKSYHLKTLLLYECESYPHPSQWSYASLGQRFLGLLQRLENCLRLKRCPHYFIQDLNLFEMLNPQKCNELAERVQRIRQQPGQVFNRLIQQP